MKLPEGWRVWLLVIGLNALAGYLWFIDRGVEPPAAGGNLLDLIRSLGRCALPDGADAPLSSFPTGRGAAW